MVRPLALVIAMGVACAAYMTSGAVVVSPPPSARAPIPAAQLTSNRNAPHPVRPTWDSRTKRPNAWPPDAVLVAGESGAHFGTVGSLRPWIPPGLPPAIRIPSTTGLNVWLAAITPIVSWVATYAPPGKAAPDHRLRLAAARDRSPVSAFAFDTPPPGAWVLAVSVRFRDAAGSATYYWHLVVT